MEEIVELFKKEKKRLIVSMYTNAALGIFSILYLLFYTVVNYGHISWKTFLALLIVAVCNIIVANNARDTKNAIDGVFVNYAVKRLDKER